VSSKAANAPPDRTAILGRHELDMLFRVMEEDGFEVIGPTFQQEAIVYDEIAASDDLPVGWTDVQEGASYRVERRDDQAVFGYNVGPTAWKRFLHPPRQTLFEARLSAEGISFEPSSAMTRLV
jgi:hypothetical protein